MMPALLAATDPIKSNNILEEGKKRFEQYCGVCHSLELPRSQHLDRKTWQWVMDDMVSEFGAAWLAEEDQKLILEYLVREQGPEN